MMHYTKDNKQFAMEQDAKRFRALMRYFKHDHIWYNVMGSPSELGDSVIEVLDTLIKDPKDHYIYDDGFNI